MIRYILAIVLLAPNIVSGQQSSHNGAPKFAPEDGKKLIIVGQDLGAVGGLNTYTDGYVDYIMGIPAGVTTYTSIPSLSGLKSMVNYGSGDVHAGAYLVDNTFDNSAIVIGLYIVNQLDNINSGNTDESIVDLANWIKNAARPVFLRIGYEFDGPWNGYDPEKFKAAWIYIVKKFDANEVRNVAFVWQSAGINTANIERWYPGDQYVNWLAYSHFDGPNPGQSIRNFANLHNKPIMIAEATPRVDLKDGSGDTYWENWYSPLFSSIYANDKIKALAYINANWDSQSMWNGQGWGDSRIQVNEAVKTKWEAELAGDNWIFGDESLFDKMEFQKWQDSIYVYSIPANVENELLYFQNSDGIVFRSKNHENIDALNLFDIAGKVIYQSSGKSSEYTLLVNNLLPNSVLFARAIIAGKSLSFKILLD